MGGLDDIVEGNSPSFFAGGLQRLLFSCLTILTFAACSLFGRYESNYSPTRTLPPPGIMIATRLPPPGIRVMTWTPTANSVPTSTPTPTPTMTLGLDYIVIDGVGYRDIPRDQERFILVSLDEQTAYAIENGRVVYQALASTGVPAHPTRVGNYPIWIKIADGPMVGPGYNHPSVHWIMYFDEARGLHAADWHNNFGHPMSHGCVNLSEEASYWFFNFADVGTYVVVR